MTKYLYVINSRGEKELFSFQKVYRSARRVGAPKSLAQKIAKKIEKEIYPEIETSEIFKKVKRALHQEKPRAALKFNLKRGMKKLGPSGFPFEKYIGEIFIRNGFNVQLNQHISGFCCRYEIDFLAKKGKLLYVGECKYRNLSGKRIHSNIALANYARFLDIKKGKFLHRTFKNIQIKSLLVTNTKFTTRTIKYSKCVDGELLGWNYPKKRGLEYLIDRQKLYPITILPSLKSYLADIFVSKRMMLVEDLLRIDISKFAKITKVPIEHLKPLLKEAKILLEK